MTDKEQIDSLKAQVNYLYAELDRLNHRLLDEGIVDGAVREVLDATPEQCLAEIKTKTLEDVARAMRKEPNYTYEDDYYISYIYTKAYEIRKQAKC